MKLRKLHPIGLAAALILQSHAATLYWDGGSAAANGQSDNTTTDPQDWLSGGNWDDGGTSAPLAAWTAGDSAVFGGSTAGQTVTAGTLTIGNVTFDTANYTINGGAITLSAASTVTTNADATINSVMSGTGSSLLKEGGGTLTLGGTNTYTGGTTVNAGTLAIATGGGTGRIRGALAIGGGATVSANTNWSFGYNNNVCVSGISIDGGTLDFTGGDENGGTSASTITMTGGTISGSRFDWYNGITNTPTLSTVASPTTATISTGFRMRFGGTNQLTISVADGAADTDLLISGNITTNATNGIIKTGDGTLMLTGTASYGGATTVNGGTLVIDGFLTNSAVTVNADGTLAGSGEVKSATVNGTLAPGGTAIDTLTVNGPLALNPGSTTVCQIDRTGGTPTADLLYVTSVTYGGTLEVTATGETLQAGDAFQLFDAVPGSYFGSFEHYQLPELSGSLSWDVTELAESGTIRVVNYAPTPVFTPGPGGYVGAQTISMFAGGGTTIYYTYTTNGTEPSDPTTASNPGAPGAGTATFEMPTDSDLWIKAIATKAGSANSQVASATYGTITTPTWDNPLGGSWSEAANWRKEVVANGANATADFSQLALSEDTTVSLDAATTIGAVIFGDQGDQYNWTLSGSTLTLAGTAPEIRVANGTTTLSSTLAGTAPITKTGAGTLRMTGLANNTGSTTVSEARLVFSTGAHNRFNGSGGLGIDSGATFEINATGEARLAAGAGNITGAGTLAKTGNFTTYMANGALHQVIQMSSGGLVWVQEGTMSDYETNAANKADLTVESGATLQWPLGVNVNAPGQAYFDAINGGGTVRLSSTAFNMGVDNGGGTFAGTITGTNAAGSLVKTGDGAQVLSGSVTLAGRTLVNGGTLTLTGSVLLKPTTNGTVNTLGGTGALVLDGVLDLDLGAADTTAGNSWVVVDVASLNESYLDGFRPRGSGADFIESAPGSGVWNLAAGSNKWTFTESTGTLTYGAGEGFDTWISGEFPGVTDPNIIGPDADPDYDGVPNLVEYALAGRSAKTPDGAAGTFANGVLTFTKRPGASGISYGIVESTNLTNWLPVTPLVNDPTTISYSLLPVTGPEKFVRLVVTQP